MLKKLFFTSIIVLAMPAAFGMSSYEISDSAATSSIENTALSNAQNQLDHIKKQMISIKKAWNIARIHIKMAEKKASSYAYRELKPIFEKIIASNAFTKRINETVSTQAESIANFASFESVKNEFNLSDFVPNATMTDFGKKLFSAMANRAYYLELGKKLAQKAQELALVIATSRPAVTTSQE